MTNNPVPFLSAGQVSFKVTPETLTAKSSEVANKVAAMRQHFGELKAAVEKTSKYWIGEAGDMHRALYQDLEDDTEEILRRLSEHPVDLVTIAQQYADVELKIQQEIQELPGDILV